MRTDANGRTVIGARSLEEIRYQSGRLALEAGIACEVEVGYTTFYVLDPKGGSVFVYTTDDEDWLRSKLCLEEVDLDGLRHGIDHVPARQAVDEMRQDELRRLVIEGEGL